MPATKPRLLAIDKPLSEMSSQELADHWWSLHLDEIHEFASSEDFSRLTTEAGNSPIASLIFNLLLRASQLHPGPIQTETPQSAD